MSDTEALRRKIEATIKTWRETTPEGKRFVPSEYNVFVLLEDGVKWFEGGLTVANLSKAYHKLSRVYDFSKDARPTKPVQASDAPAPEVKAQAAEPAEIPEHELPGYPVRGGLEDGWRYQQRLNAWREQRAQQAWRDRENKRLAAQPPAQSTINRTKAELRLRKLEQDLWNQKKANQS
jgi:hypothetical protein